MATKAPITPSGNAFGELIHLQEMFFLAEQRLDAIQSQADAALAAQLDKNKTDYLAAKLVRDEAEEGIKALALAHPEWKDGETIRTPYGSVHFRKSSKLDVPDEARTLATLAITDPEMSTRLTRTVNTLDREALEGMPDDTLSLLGISRTTTTGITVKPAKVDLGKAANPKTATATATKAAKAKGGKGAK